MRGVGSGVEKPDGEGDGMPATSGFFMENVRLFANAQEQPEKYNLYMGLANLAQDVQALRSEVARLTREVNRLNRT